MPKPEPETLAKDVKPAAPAAATRRVKTAATEKFERPVKRSKLSAGLRKILDTHPEKEWCQIRAFFIESEEEGQLIDSIPIVRLAMQHCPNRLMPRLMRGSVELSAADEAFRKLHEAIHAPRQAALRILELAGMSVEIPRSGPRIPKATVLEEGAPESSPVTPERT